MKDVALITIHGMGVVEDDYYVELEQKLQKRLGEEWSRVSFHAVQYAPAFQSPQDALWEAMTEQSAHNELDWATLRKFLLFGFGDAGSMEHSAHRDGAKYREVQEAVQGKLELAFRQMGRDPAKPVVIIAQSLGCKVISNYLWDAQKDQYIFKDAPSDDPDLAAFLKLTSLENLVTTGCNIPLFISGLKTRVCFAKPNSDFVWDNYYDPDDVLGWPLRQLGDTYQIVRDHCINAGGLTSWTPLSHEKYWGDSDVIDPLAEILKSKL